MAKADNASGASEKLIEVRLLRDYVPANAQERDSDHPGVFVKVKAGSPISLPKEEAKRTLELGIAVRVIGDND